MTIEEIGEFGLIEKIRKTVSSKKPASLILGIGDDAAVFGVSGKRAIAVTTDALIEGVHFDFKYTDWKTLGWKALAVNLSDLAAMGAVPKWALISLSLPPKTKAADVRNLYRGIGVCLKTHGGTIIGGNMTGSTDGVMISVTAAGEVDRKKILKRSAAKAGDVIAVTGHLGASAAGLKLLQKKRKISAELRKRHVRPEPRLAWIHQLLKKGVKIHAAIDISDGLAADLGHICEAGNLGAKLDARAIPIHIDTITAALSMKDEVLDYALYGGEDYELLLTLPAKEYLKAKKILKNNIHAVGILTKDPAMRLFTGPDVSKKLELKGFKHF